MANFADSLTVFWRTVIVCGVSALVVIVSYYFVDRPVAFFIHAHEVAKTRGLEWLTYPPPIVQSWSPLALSILVVFRIWKPWNHWQRVLFVACVSLIVADQFRESLGDLSGRYWPETWHDNNPSLIGDGTYGFHPFRSGDDNGSFPSGHAARILGFITVLWIGHPRARWICGIAAAPMLAALVAMNFHFVSDVIAGSVLGGVVGTYAALLGGIGPCDMEPTAP
jgi:membrane-associated phospholipid phosphatase